MQQKNNNINDIDNMPSEDSMPSLTQFYTHSHLYFHGPQIECKYNEHGQCLNGFRYFCSVCHFGLGGAFSDCPNIKCSNKLDCPSLVRQHLKELGCNIEELEKKEN